MHEILILNIIRSKFKKAQEEFKDEFAQHMHYFLWDDIPLNQVETNIDCVVRISLYTKHLANSDNEGIEFEAHIHKTKRLTFKIEIRFFQSNGTSYEYSLFAIDLENPKATKKDVLVNIFKTIDLYKTQIIDIIYKDYFPNPI